MNKNMLKICSVVMAILAVVAIVGAITVTGGGFLDLSNLARYALIGIAVIFAGVAIAMGRKGWRA